MKQASKVACIDVYFWGVNEVIQKAISIFDCVNRKMDYALLPRVPLKIHSMMLPSHACRKMYHKENERERANAWNQMESKKLICCEMFMCVSVYLVVKHAYTLRYHVCFVHTFSCHTRTNGDTHSHTCLYSLYRRYRFVIKQNFCDIILLF